ncbi:bifunctional aminoglycoside phosphotransferase/ATP-binding protein [Kaarinaea lacus]
MKLIQQLLNPALYPHPVKDIQLLETHISWVVLTGDYVYKLKKPVNFGFLDFSTLEKRKYYCSEELRLNKRLAPQIYLQTVAISGTEDHPQLDGPGPAIEYAVKMRQFHQKDQFDRLLACKQLHRHDMTELAQIIAQFHQSTQHTPPDSVFGDPDHIQAPVTENFSQIDALIDSDTDRTLLKKVADWSQRQIQSLKNRFIERKQQGFVRECHGDMHLRNIAKFQDATVIFDCIEFNDNLRWIDVISEIAFIEMDLHDRGRPDFANVLLNSYLQHTGDYPAMDLLRFYLVYRAMVRAKVDCIRAHQAGLAALEHAQTMNEFRHYLNLAHQFTKPVAPFLLITCGLSGCGKTYATDGLMDYLPFIRIRSDVERKRLFGLAATESSDSTLGAGIYTVDASRKTYARLANMCRAVLSAQWSVLIDAAFLQDEQRQLFRNIADELHVPFLILHFTAPYDVLVKRVTHREKEHQDASEADRQVLEAQIKHQQLPSSNEQPVTLKVDTRGNIPFSDLAQTIQARLKLA